MKIHPTDAVKLQALRAAPMDANQIQERFAHGVSGLVSKGLVEIVGGYYKLTAKGREACPNRRSNMPPAPLLPVVHRKQIDLQVKPVIARSSELVALPMVGEKRKEEKMKTLATPAKQPMALQILQLIETNPNCTSAEIREKLGVATLDSYIRGYIDAGKVIATRLDPKNNRAGVRFKIADGLKVQDFYKGVSKLGLSDSKPVTKPAEPKVVQEHVPKFGQAEPAPSQPPVSNTVPVEGDEKVVEQVKAFAAAFDQATAGLLNREKITDAASDKPRIRFAITSEHTLIIQGASYQDIELSKADTEALVEFVETIAMTIPVHGYSVAGASL